jgi:putative tryptophan/tyrosine transport system substrate-binding protein
MRRREFITLIGGAATWAAVARAQSGMRRIAVLMATRESDVEGRARLQAFLQGFRQLGWTEGRNVTIDIRWTGGSIERTRDIVAELVALAPDVIVVNGSPGAAAMKRATSSIPVVFMMVNDPVAQGFIASMSRPGGNITGFTNIDFSVVGKSVGILKTISPTVARVGLMFNPDSYPYYDTYLRTFQNEAKPLVEMTRAAVRSLTDIDTVIESIAAQPGGGLAVAPDPFTSANWAAIRAALERHRLPHTVTFRQFVSEGALMSYGPDSSDICRRSASYVDRILKGANPAELPAQAPDKFELAINLKTAKAFGIAVPPSVLATADEVIE